VASLHAVNRSSGKCNTIAATDHGEFHTNNIDTVKECQMFFCFEMSSTLLKKRVENFQKQYQNHQNTVCQIVNNFKP